MNVTFKTRKSLFRKTLIVRFVILFILFQSPGYLFSQNSSDHHASVLSHSEKVSALHSRFDSIFRKSPQEASDLVKRALNICQQNNLVKESGDSYYRLGQLDLDNGNFKAASFNLNKALEIYKNVRDYLGICNCYKDLGTVFGETGNRSESFKYYSEGLKLAEQKDFKELIGKFTNNIGYIYQSEQHYEKALEYFKRSAELSKSGSLYAISLANIGLTYKFMDNYSQAIDYYNKSLKVCEENQDEYSSLTALDKLSAIYMEQGKVKAYEITDRLLQVQRRLGLDKDLIVTYNRLGLLYSDSREYEKSLEYFNKSLELAKKLGSSHVPYIHANIADVYRDINQYEKAFNHIQSFHNLKDSLYSIEQKSITEKLLIQFDTEKKEKEIELLKKDQLLKKTEQERKEIEYAQNLMVKSLAEQESKNDLLKRNREISLLKKDRELQEVRLENNINELVRQKQIKNIVFGSALVICIPIIILMIVYKQKVRQKELLALKTEEINRQQTLDMLMNFELKNIRASIEGQEIERKRIAQELHDGIGGSLAGIKMRMQSLSKKGEVNDQFRNVIQSIDDVYREVRTLSHHLTPPGMHRRSFVEFLSKYLNDISEVSKFELEYMFHGEEELNGLPDESKVEIYRILQELVNNIIKHAEANFVEVQLVWSDNCVNLIVEDRGKGFNPVSVKSGIGLNSIAKRVESMGGKLNIDSKPGRGTIINVDIYCNPTKLNTVSNI